jgi:hypothetical protein
VVDVAPRRAALDAHGAGRRIDVDAAHRRQVDDERVVPHAEAAGVVAAASHGQKRAALAREVHGGDGVGGVRAARDEARMAVDHAVVDGACVVVAGISGLDQLAPEGGPELIGDEPRAGRGGGRHRGLPPSLDG